MTGVQEWAIGLCAAAFAFAVVKGLTPHGRMGRVVSALSATVFFCCLLTPLRDIGTWLSSVVPTAGSVTAEVSRQVETLTDEQLLFATETALLSDAKMLLSAFDVTVSAVEIQRDITRRDSIYIDCVRVILDREDHPVSQEVYTVLEQAWSVPVEVWYSG